jgi:small subunit ribosomal protein S1
MILDHDKANGRVALSTKTLEPAPGDMLKSMETVFAQADATAARYHERLEAERQAREAAAKDIVAGLGGAMVRARTYVVFCIEVCTVDLRRI